MPYFLTEPSFKITIGKHWCGFHCDFQSVCSKSWRSQGGCHPAHQKQWGKQLWLLTPVIIIIIPSIIILEYLSQEIGTEVSVLLRRIQGLNLSNHFKIYLPNPQTLFNTSLLIPWNFNFFFFCGLFPVQLGSQVRIVLLHFTRYSASFSVTPAASLFSLIQSSHLLFGLPLFLLPTPILLTLFPRILLLFWSHDLHSLNFSSDYPAPIAFLMVVFRILSSLIFPTANRGILI